MKKVIRFALSIVAAVVVSCGFSSCSSEPEAPCAEMMEMQKQYAQKMKEMQDSWTPMGARSDLNDLCTIWRYEMIHASGCKQCRNWFEKTTNKSLQEIDAATQQEFAQIAQRLDSMTSDMFFNFLRGLLLGAEAL